MASPKRRPRLRIDTLEAREVPAAAPILLQDINVGGGNSNPTGFVDSVANGFFFTASDGATGVELYHTATAAPGTVTQLKDINPGGGNGVTAGPVKFGSKVYFGGNTGSDTELWTSDGTPGATALIQNINATGSSNPRFLTNYNDTILYFVANDGTNGDELYRTNGTATGAALVTDLTTTGTGSTVFNGIYNVGGKIYAIAKANGAASWSLYAVNATGSLASSIGTLANNVTATLVGGAAGADLFIAGNNGVSDNRLFRLNSATNAVTQLFTTTQNAFGGTSPLAYANGFVYFASADVPAGSELWQADITANVASGGGTRVADINSGSGDASPRDFEVVNNVVYFSANNGTGRQLYVTTGSAVTTVPAPLSVTNATSSDPRHVTAFNGQLVFVGRDAGGTDTLYQYDPLNRAVLPAITGFGNLNAASTVFTPIGQSLYMAVSNATDAKGVEPYTFDPVPDAPVFDQTINPDSGFASAPATLSDRITNASGTLTISGRADAAGQAITVKEGAATVATPTTGGNGVWSFNAAALPEGTHTLTATATDAGGTSPVSAVALTFTIDRTAPVAPTIAANVFSGNAIDLYTTANTVTLSGVGAEANSFINLYVSPNLATPLQALIPVDGSGNWTFTTTGVLTEGQYDFFVKGIDIATNITQNFDANPYRVVVDRTAPAAPVIVDFDTDTGSSATDNNTSDKTPTLTGTAEAFAVVMVYVGVGASPALLGSVTADDQGAWSFPITAALGDGPYRYRATATDRANNASAGFSNALDITVDTTPAMTPAFTGFSIDSGTVGDFVTNDTTLTLTGTADAGASLTIKEGAVLRGTATADGLGVWSVTTGVLAAGGHTFTVDATDLAGNLNTTPLTTPTITIDTTGPGAPAITGVSFDSGSSSTDGVTNNTSLTISGTFVAGTASVTVKDGANTLGLATPGAGTWTYVVSGLSEGLHNFTAVAADAADNPTSSAVFPVTVDTTAPATPVYTSFSDDTGTLGDNKTRDNTLTLTGTAEAGAVINVSRNGTPVLPATLTGTSWSYTSPVLADGAYTFTVTATDLAGNVSLILTAPTITIDSTLPERPVISGITTDTGFSPTDGVTSDTTLTVAGSTAGGTAVTIKDGASTLGMATITGTGTTWTFDASALLSVGSHSLTATSLDGLGNSVTSAVFPVLIDVVAPSAPVYSNFTPDTGAPNDNRTNSATITLNGVAETNATVTVKEGAATLGTTTATGGSWAFLTPTLPDGTHTFTVTATDAAGNVSLSLTPPAITVDTTPPAAPLIVTLTTDSGASPTDGVTNDTTLKLDGTLTAGAGGTTAVDIYDGMTLLGPAVISGSAWTYTTAALAPGNHSLTARATDAAGNTADSAAKAVTVDTTAPATPAFTAYSDDTGATGDGLTSDATLTLTGTAEAGALIVVKEGGVTVGMVTATGGAWAVTTAALPDGSHTFAVTATDLAGNASAALPLTPIIIDSTAPAAPTLNGFKPEPAGALTFGLTTAASKITLFGSFGEEDLPVFVYDGLALLTGTPNSGPGGTWSFITGTLTAGTHTFMAKTLDAAGNESPVSAALVVEVDPGLTTPDLVVPEKAKNVVTLKGSQILAAHPVADTPGALKGLAVTGLTGNGVWSYSAGGKVIPLAAGALTPTHAVLLRDTDVLKFTPAADSVGLARVTYRAWDQTGGRAGEFAAVGAGGAMTPFSATPQTFVLGISETNDRPTLKLTDSPLMQPGVATTVGALLKGRFADVDAFKIPGIAVVGATGTGTWEFKAPAVATYTPMGKPNTATAILLDETYSVRFRPDSGFKGKATLVYVPWDGSAGAAGDVGVKAITSAFGKTKETATVNAGNSAPVLALPAQAPALPAIAEDTVSPAGYKVSNLIKDKVTDADGVAAVGIAVTGADNAFGQWQFKAKGGWQSLAGATSRNVLLLSGAGQLRFVPNADHFGDASITYRAWDGSTGYTGEWADPTGDTAFSSEVETASVTVTPVNDRPVLLTAGTPVLPALPAIIAAGSIPGTLVSALIGGSLSDAETSAATVGIAVTAVTGTGRWQYNRASGAARPSSAWIDIGAPTAGAALLLAPNQFVRFVPTAIPQSQPQIATLSFKGWDVSQGSGTATGNARVDTRTSFAFSEATETAYVSQGNQRPVLTGTPPAFPDLTEDPKTNNGQGVKALLGTTESLGNAPLAGEGQGIAVTAVDNTGGKWQYALANTFADIPAVSNTNALLLPDSAKLKFVPNADFNGAAGKITYKAWDRTVGAAGEFANSTADLPSGRGAFSTQAVVTGPNVTAVADRPVVSAGAAVVMTPVASGNAIPPGDAVSSLIPAGAVTDADGATSFGIAVTGLTGAGTWAYSVDNGANWTTISDKPSASKALVLSASATTRVRYSGADGLGTITYRAWDQSDAHVTGDIVNPGSALELAFSVDSLTATVSIGNSAPTQ